MAKITISRVIELSKTLATEAGEQLEPYLQYTQLFFEQSLRALRNGLTFEDNMNAQVITALLTSGSEQVIATRATPVHVIPSRVFSTTEGITDFVWFINERGELVVKVVLTNAPSTPLNVQILVFFV